MKSHVSELLSVALSVYSDAAAKCDAYQQRDLDTLRSRVEHEGLSFLTITLPELGKDFERSLAESGIAPERFRNFGKRLKAPAFLQGFFEQVFNNATGRIHDDPSLAAIEGIRQIAYTFKKVKIECTEQRVARSLRDFQQCELDLQETMDAPDVEYFVNVSSCLWTHSFASGNIPETFELIPKHGPGATCERISGNQKYIHKKWYDRLEPYFPVVSFAFPSEDVSSPFAWRGYELPEFESLEIVSEEHEEPVRVTPVPKTLKGPRIIAIEPVCMQYTQQALAKWLVGHLESTRPTAGHVNFTDQSINRELAIRSSADQTYATIDMSSASDRVPYALAIRMFDSVPDIQGAISACRSTRAKLPNGDILHLRKFASMGSALCFPVESMYFYTICVGTLLKIHNLPVTMPNIIKVARQVFVYGDDILVPTEHASTVVNSLQKYYCKVNATKSFWTGKFRESCGMDAYDGEEVTPTYLRSTPPRNRRDTSGLISWVKASNHFYKRGYWKTAHILMQRCESILGILPQVGPDAACLGKASFQRFVSIERWNKHYQSFEVKGWCATPVYQDDKLEGCGALMKFYLNALDDKDRARIDRDHLMRTARHGAVALKRRWTSPY